MLRDWVRKYSKLLLTLLLFSLFHKCGTQKYTPQKALVPIIISSEAARTRTMEAVSSNDEEGFVWIIPWYSGYYWVES